MNRFISFHHEVFQAKAHVTCGSFYYYMNFRSSYRIYPSILPSTTFLSQQSSIPMQRFLSPPNIIRIMIGMVSDYISTPQALQNNTKAPDIKTSSAGIA